MDVKRLFFLLFSGALLALALTGCQPKVKKRSDDRPLVIVSIPPYMEIVKAIADDTVDVESVISVGYNPHVSEITPRQMELVQQADLWIGVGESYEKKLLTTLRQSQSRIQIIQINEKIPLLSFAEDTNFVDACQDINLPLKESKDIHFWLSPKRLKLQAMIIAEGLIQLQPHKEMEYKNNLKTYLRLLEDADQKLIDLLRPFRGSAIVVSHAALGYFCYDYSLVQIAVECEGKSPLPQNVRAVLKLARNSNTQCVFTFPGHNNKGALLIAQHLNLKTYEIDPLNTNLISTIEQIATDITAQP